MFARLPILWLALSTSLAVSVGVDAPPASQPVDEVAKALGWPRSAEEGGNQFTIYQPQIESWDANVLKARAAMAVRSAEQKKESFGVVWLSARTEVDKERRLVTLEDLKVDRLTFPSNPGREAELLAMLRGHLSAAVKVVPLDHLESAYVASLSNQVKPVAVANDPPEILIATTPSLLVLIDGEPALRPVEGANGVMRVINTRALILLDQGTNRYFLRAMNTWVEAPAPTGPWQPTPTAPASFDQIKDTLAKSNAIDPLDPARPEAAGKQLPQIFTRTKPTEVIQLTGEPEYTPIAGTNLLYVKNTDSAVFMEPARSQYYVLVSGRWFTAASLRGPWTYLPGKDLPADFAKIPADSPKANVLVSVPGTAQAKEAVIASNIPQTAAVKIADTHLTVSYDGEPKFKKIDGAQDLQYAVNSPLPVIYVQDLKSYWCVQNGVWFTAPKPTGLWVVATSVPGVIYTIPASSALHYVTYVRVYNEGDGVVYVGYTPGYMGTCITADGVIVYGTGYYYPAYVGTTWVGYPPTYGYGAGFACGAITGLAFGFAAGAIMGDCWVHPYWGPCWGYSHVDINTASVYRNWRGGVTYANRHYDFDGWSGESNASGFARSFNPYSGRSSVGGYENHFDHRSGDFDAKAGGATFDRRTGVIQGGGIHAEGDVDHLGDTDVDRNRFRYNTRTNTGAAITDDNVYAGHDGNVYRYNKDDGWQHYSDGDWKETSRDQNFAQNRENLESQRSSRDVGQQRFDNFRSSPRHASGGRVGGGLRRR